MPLRQRKISARLSALVAAAGLALALLPGDVRGQAPLRKIGEMELALVGLSARVDPAHPVVPKNVASGVRVVVVAGGQELTADEVARLLGGPFAAKAELQGPGLPGAFELQTAAADPDPLLLPLPPLPVAGDYELTNVRLVATARTLDVAPRVDVQVIDQILVTSVKSRSLTLDEIKEKGIVLDSDDYLGFEFTLGLKLESKPIDFRFPVVFDREGVLVPDFLKPPPPPVRAGVAMPTIIPVMLEVDDPGGDGDGGEKIALTLPNGGPIRIPSVVVIPGNVAFLKQFFSAQLFVANGAPFGSGLVVRDVKGKLKLPPGPDGVTAPPGATLEDLGDDPLSLPKILRNGQTITQPVEMPVRGLGADGLPETADDEDALPPAAQAQAEFLIRGEREGFHTVDFDLRASLEGLPVGPVKVSGKAQGGLLVRNASFDMTFTVPGIVRADEEFKVFATLTNIGKGLGNDVKVELDAGLAGAELVDPGAAVKTIATLLPGDAQTVEFLFRSNVTGQVVASYLDFDDQSAGGGTVTGRMRFSLGVGERGVPLSPDTLVLPTAVDALVPPDAPPGQRSVVDAAMRVLGQAWSIANAPSGSLPKTVVRTSKAVVTQKALALAEAGLRVSLGQEREDAVRDLAFDFFGGSPLDPGFDQLLRQTEAGRGLAAVLGRELRPPANAAGLIAFEEKVAEFAASGHDFVSFAVDQPAGNPFAVALEDAKGRRMETTGAVLPAWAIPGGAILPLGEGAAPPLLGFVTAPTTSPYVLDLQGPASASGSGDVSFTFPDGQGSFVRAAVSGLDVPAGGRVRLVVDLSRPGSVRLDRDDDGDGAFTKETVSTTPLLRVGPALVSARVIGPDTLAGASPLGNQVAILFDRVVDETTAGLASTYGMVDNSVRLARRQLSGRLVFGALERPEGPYVPVRLSVDGMKDTRGGVGPGGDVEVGSLLTEPGAVVRGRVLTAEGEPVVPGSIVYTATRNLKGAPCLAAKAGIAVVPLDANGRYELRYVRQDPCGPFSIVTTDPDSKARAEVSAFVRAAGEEIELDVVLFGRGSVAGQVRERAGGKPVPGAKVVAVSVTDPQVGGSATADAEGRYTVPGITVGPVSVRAAKGIAAGLGAGRIDRAGTTAQVDVLLDTGSVKWTGTLRSKKGVAPSEVVPGGPVVYFVDGTPVGVTRTDALGKFSFTAMPAGATRVEGALNTRDVARTSRVTAEGDLVEQDLLILIPEDAELGSVRGVVRFPDGQPAGDVLVRVGSSAALSAKPNAALPGSGGEFLVKRVPMGSFFVRAGSKDGKRSGSSRVTLAPDARDVETAIVLSGLGTAVFTVVDPAGQPVADVPVRLVDCPEDPCGCTQRKTSAAGTAEFEGLPLGSVHAKAFFTSGTATDVVTASASITRDGDRATGLLRLSGSGAVKGIVLDHRGQPALGADLEVFSRVFVNDGTTQCGLVPTVSHRFRTKADGRFRFTGVLAGPVSVTASQAFYPTPVSEKVALLNGREEELTLRLADTMAGVFTGLVYLPDGETLAGKGVEVTADGPLPEVVVKTDGTGRFRFAKILPQGLYTVTARDPVTGGVVRETVYLRAAEPLERDFRLKGKGEVRVRVVDGAEEPVGDAYVRLREEEHPGRLFERQIDKSNEGVAVFKGVFEGPVSLEASDSFGRGGRASTVLPGPGQEAEVRVRLTVTGRVAGRFRRPDGTPIPFGVVKLLVAGRPFGQITTASSASELGAFAFNYVPAGPVVLEARDPQTGRTGRAQGSLQQEGEVLDLDVFAQALGTVEGLVTSNGLPEPGALVEITSGTFKATTDTDGDGRYRLEGVPAGRVAAKASLANGFLAGTAQGELAQEGLVLSLDVSLRGSATVRGSVAAYDGSHPLSQVTIRAGGVGGASLKTFTAEDGTFEIDRVPAGTASIDADVLDSIDQASATVAVPEGGVLQVPPLQLPGLGTVEVRVEDANGVAVAAAEITLQDSRGGGRYGSLGAGVARFTQVPAGAVTVSARDPDERAGQTTAALVAGATSEVLVKLQATFTLSGQVRRHDGEPASAGVEVRLRHPRYSATATLEGGAFSFSFVPVGEYRLEARTAAGDKGAATGLILETGVAPVDLVLNGVGPVEVKVLDFTAVPVPGAQIMLTSRGPYGGLYYGSTDSTGASTFPGVLRGPLEILASARGVAAPLVLAPWDDGLLVQKVEARLPQLGRVEGRVLAASSLSGVAGATVLLGYRSTASGADGGFAFDDVPLGAHSLTARVAGRTRAYEPGVLVTAAEPLAQRDLLLIGAAKVRGRVYDSLGKPAGGASLVLKSAVLRYGGRFDATADGNGLYSFADVPVGPFSLVATRGAERVDVAGLAMSDPAADQTIDLDLVADLADLDEVLYDGNGFSWQVAGDGSFRTIQGRQILAGSPRLRLTRDSTTFAFTGSSHRYVPSEQERRELVLRQGDLAGLDVTRKVYVPNEGHFVRYLELLENPTGAAVTVEVAVETGLNDAWYPTVAVLKTSSAPEDAALDGADGWAVLDDHGSDAEDVDVLANFWRFAPLGIVFADPTGPNPPSVTLVDGELATRWTSVTVGPHQSVAFLHAYSVRATRAGAEASAARLLSLPPELLAGMSRAEAQAVSNFAVPLGPGPADGPLSTLAPLPANDGRVKGQVRSGDGQTVLEGYAGILRPKTPFLDRAIPLRSGALGKFDVSGNLVALKPPAKILLPRGDYELVFEQHKALALDAEARTSGTFAPGAGLSVQDVVFPGFAVGTVKRASGASVSGAQVVLEGAPGVAEAVTDGAGSFRFPVVPPGLYSILAKEPALGVVTPTLPMSVQAGGQPPVALVFPALGSIVGTLRASTLLPLPSGCLALVVNGVPRYQCSTDGSYSFGDVPPGEYTIAARDGRTGVTLTRQVVASEGPATTVPDIVFPPVGRVEVLVTSGGAPLHGARVSWAAPSYGLASIDAGQTDLYGKRSILSAPDGEVVVEVVHPETDFVKKTASPPSITVEGQVVPISFDLVGVARLIGGFETRDGRTVPGSKATALSADGALTYGMDTTTSEGYFIEHVPAMPIRLRGQWANGGVFFTAESDLDLSEKSGELVPAPAPLPLGRVAASGGRDFWALDLTAGASVTLRLLSDASDVVLQVVGPDGSVFAKGETTGTTNALVTFTAPATGRYVAIVSGRGTEGGLVDYRLGSSSATRSFRAYSGPLVEGRVVRDAPGGAPVAGQRVVLSSLPGKPFAITDAEGKYSFPDVLSSPSSDTVDVLDAEGVLVGRAEGPGALPDLVVPDRGTVTVTATRVGVPVAGLQVRFTSDHPVALEADKDRFRATNAAGMATTLLPIGLARVEAIDPLTGSLVTDSKPLAAGGAVNLGLALYSPDGVLKGTMRTSAGLGLGVCTARIVVLGVTRSSNCAGDGSYLFADVPAGSYDVTATDNRSQAKLTQAVAVAQGTVTTADFTFPPVGSVSVSVTSKGVGLAGASLSWTSAVRGPSPVAAGSTNAQGTRSIPNVPGETVQVFVTHPLSAYVKASGEVTILEGQAVSVAFDLPPVVTLTGEFKTRDGRAVAGQSASVLSLDETITYRNATVAGSTFTALNLPPGPVRLRGRASGSPASSGEVELVLPEGATSFAADVPVPLGHVAVQGGRDFWEFEAEAGTSVNLQLLGEGGPEPAPHVVVQAIGPDGSVFALGEASATTNAVLNFTPTVGGRFVVVASARGGETGRYRLGSSAVARVFRPHFEAPITGRVVKDESGGPGAAGLEVVLVSLPGHPFAITGPDGDYTFPAVLPGASTVEAFDAEGARIGETTGEGLALPALVVPARGTVTASATRLGVPLSGLTVRFTSDHPAALASDKDRLRATNGSGVATTLLPVGSVRAEANDPITGLLLASATKALADGGAVDLPLVFPDVSTNVTGTVRNGDGLVPLGAGASVELRKSGVLTQTVETDAASTYLFASLGPGSYTLTARKDGFASLAVPLSLPTGSPTLAQDLDVPIPALRVRVLDSAGAAVDPAAVEVSTCGWPLEAAADGRYLYIGRPCGYFATVTVQAVLTDGSGLWVSQSVDYPPTFTGTRDVTLNLPPTGNVQVQVDQTDGTPVAVIVTDFTGFTRYQAGTGGTFSFARVRAGQITVVAQDGFGTHDETTLLLGSGEESQVTLALPAGNLDLSLAHEGALLSEPVELDVLDAPGGPRYGPITLQAGGVTRWRIPPGAFRVRFVGRYDWLTDLWIPPAAFEGMVALGETREVALAAGSHVALPATLGSFQAELGNEGLGYELALAFVRTKLQDAEPFVSPARPEHGGRGLRDLGLIVPGSALRTRRVRYVPASDAFARTLTWIENPGATRTVSLASLLGESAQEGGSAAVVASSDGNTDFDASDSWVVVQNGTHLFGAVLGSRPGLGPSFQSGSCGDGCSPTYVSIGHELEIPAGTAGAFLTFSLSQPYNDASDLDAIVARAQALSDLSLADALADLSPGERAAILNFTVPAFGSVRGVVEDASGARVGGARVVAVRAGLVARQVEAAPAGPEAGAFELVDLPVGEYTLVAIHPVTGRPGRLVAEVLEGGPHDLPAPVVLPSDAEVRAVTVQAVLEDDASPAAGASVALRLDGYWPAWPDPVALDAGGLHTFAEVPSLPLAYVGGVAPWEAVPEALVPVPAGAAVTVDLTLREVSFVGLPYELATPGESYRVSSAGSVDQALAGSVPFYGTFAAVAGVSFDGIETARQRLQGRELVLGPLDVGGLQVTRRVFVPASGAFVRTIDVLRNPGGASGPASFRLDRYLYSGGAGEFAVVAKSGAGADVTGDDAYVVASVPGVPVAGLVFAGAGLPNRPDSFTWETWPDGASVVEEWSALEVPADGQLLVMQFLIRRPAGQEAAAHAQAVALMNLTDPEALLGLSAAEKAAVHNFVVP